MSAMPKKRPGKWRSWLAEVRSLVLGVAFLAAIFYANYVLGVSP